MRREEEEEEATVKTDGYSISVTKERKKECMCSLFFTAGVIRVLRLPPSPIPIAEMFVLSCGHTLLTRASQKERFFPFRRRSEDFTSCTEERRCRRHISI